MKKKQLAFYNVFKFTSESFSKNIWTHCKIASVVFVFRYWTYINLFNNDDISSAIIENFSFLFCQILFGCVEFFIVILLLCQISADIKCIHAYKNGKRYGFFESYWEALKDFPQILKCHFIFLLKILVSSFLLTAPFLLGMIYYLSLPKMVFFSSVFWTKLHVLPGFVLNILGVFYLFSCLIDSKKGKDAFIFSQKLIKKNFMLFFDIGFPVLILTLGLAYLFDGGISYVIYRQKVMGNFTMIVYFKFFKYIILSGVHFYFLVVCYHMYDQFKKGIE